MSFLVTFAEVRKFRTGRTGVSSRRADFEQKRATTMKKIWRFCKYRVSIPLTDQDGTIVDYICPTIGSWNRVGDIFNRARWNGSHFKTKSGDVLKVAASAKIKAIENILSDRGLSFIIYDVLGYLTRQHKRSFVYSTRIVKTS
jgi:hypothetical protein